jgi:hypothetical protein
MLKVAPQFWQIWKEFEIKHGNEDTVREMLRIKRSVQAMYNTQVKYYYVEIQINSIFTVKHLVREDIDVNKHERLSIFTLRHCI